MPAYKVVEWKRKPIDGLICPVEEIINRKHVRLIHTLRSRHILQHWPDDNIRIDDGEVEVRAVVRHVLPCGLFSKFLGRVVAGDNVVVLDRILGRDLRMFVIEERKDWEEVFTGFQSASVYGFPGLLMSSNSSRTATALPRRTKRLSVGPPDL